MNNNNSNNIRWRAGGIYLLYQQLSIVCRRGTAVVFLDIFYLLFFMLLFFYFFSLSWATIGALPCCPAHLAIRFNMFFKHVLLAEQINEYMSESAKVI